SNSEFVVLTEGIPDTLRCLEAGHSAVGCTGLNLSDTQSEKLRALKKPVIVAFDNDQEGEIGASRLVQELWDLEVSSLSIPAQYKDLAEMTTARVKTLIDSHINELYG